MQTADALRRMIRSARDLHVIVRTMKTLSAVNIRHFEQAVALIDEFYQTIERGLQVVLGQGRLEVLPSRGSETAGLCALLLGSDQGLCGGFNDQIVSFMLDKLSMRPAREKMILCVGARPREILEETGVPVEEYFPVAGSLSGIPGLLHNLVLKLFALQEERGVGEIVLFYNQPVSNVSFEPSEQRILPLDEGWFHALASKDWPSRVLPMFTMDLSHLFSALIRKYVFAVAARAVVASMASENAARLASMQAAEKNIDERIAALDALYRNQRQNAITAELLDIVSGFEVLQERGESR